jgi:Methyltransferase domain
LHQIDGRDYYACPICQLISVPRHQHLSAAAEKAEYDLHKNDPGDEGYRAFLGRLFNPMVARLAKGAKGLDFGSGPGPTLSVMFNEAGYNCVDYDIFYAPQTWRLRQKYDFITLSEVAEHLRDPWGEVSHLWGLLNPGGLMGVMTKRWTDAAAFKGWHYTRDPTHISFFHDHTFRWLAEKLGAADLTFEGADVVILEK